MYLYQYRILTRAFPEDYITGCVLDFGYIKFHDRLMSVNLSIQNELDADLNTIKQIEIGAQLKKLNSNDNAPDVSNYQSMFVLAILEEMKEGRLKFSQGSIALL